MALFTTGSKSDFFPGHGATLVTETAEDLRWIYNVWRSTAFAGDNSIYCRRDEEVVNNIRCPLAL